MTDLTVTSFITALQRAWTSAQFYYYGTEDNLDALNSPMSPFLAAQQNTTLYEWNPAYWTARWETVVNWPPTDPRLGLTECPTCKVGLSLGGQCPKCGWRRLGTLRETLGRTDG